MAIMVEVTKKLEACSLWAIMLKYYKKQTFAEVLHRSYRYVINHPQKVLMYIIIIEGVVTGISSYIRAIIQSGFITGMTKARLHKRYVY